MLSDQTHCPECGCPDDGTQTFCEGCGVALVDDHEIVCQWFARCDHRATRLRSHPVLDEVPICDRCDARVEAMKAN